MLMQIRQEGVSYPYPRHKQMNKHQLEKVEEGAARESNLRNFLPQHSFPLQLPNCSPPRPHNSSKSLPLVKAKLTLPPNLSLLVLLVHLKFLPLRTKVKRQKHIMPQLSHSILYKTNNQICLPVTEQMVQRGPRRNTFLF